MNHGRTVLIRKICLLLCFLLGLPQLSGVFGILVIGVILCFLFVLVETCVGCLIKSLKRSGHDRRLNFNSLTTGVRTVEKSVNSLTLSTRMSRHVEEIQSLLKSLVKEVKNVESNHKIDKKIDLSQIMSDVLRLKRKITEYEKSQICEE